MLENDRGLKLKAFDQTEPKNVRIFEHVTCACFAPTRNASIHTIISPHRAKKEEGKEK